MSKAPSNFRQTDVKRAVQAVESAGVKIARIELAGGKITIVPAPALAESAATDEWKVA
jgi:hypothetical protein